MNWTAGFSPCQASYGGLFFSALVGDLFRINTAVLTASPQNVHRTALALSMQRTMAITVWLRRSMTLFSCGEYGGMS